MPRVLISDALSPRAAEIFAARGIEVDLAPGLGREELKARIGGYDGLAVRSATKVTAGLIERAANLKVIGKTTPRSKFSALQRKDTSWHIRKQAAVHATAAIQTRNVSG